MEKKTGWLIYDKAGAQYNKQYIAMHKEEGEALQISFSLLYAEEINFGVKNGEMCIWYQGQLQKKPDFAICRTIAPKLSMMLEWAGIRVFNSSFVSEIANDKAKTYAYLAGKGIPMTDSVFGTAEWLNGKIDGFEEDTVIKAVNGHGGVQVFRTGTDNTSSIQTGIGESDVIVQSMVKGPGQDVRVYVIGTEIVAAVCRTSQDGFRSNYSLGGKVELYELSSKQKDLVEKIIGEFDFGLVGIDFLIDEQEDFVFNEIEDVVGARMLYQVSDINLLHEYFVYILSQCN